MEFKLKRDDKLYNHCDICNYSHKEVHVIVYVPLKNIYRISICSDHHISVSALCHLGIGGVSVIFGGIGGGVCGTSSE